MSAKVLWFQRKKNEKLKSLLGAIQYLTEYVKSAKHTAIYKHLYLGKKAEWKWTEYSNAFEKLSETTLKHNA